MNSQIGSVLFFRDSQGNLVDPDTRQLIDTATGKPIGGGLGGGGGDTAD